MRWRESDCRAALLIRNNHCCDQLDQLGLPVGARCSALEPFPFRLNRNGGSLSCLDALSSREPVSTPDHVRGRLSLENALATITTIWKFIEHPTAQAPDEF